MSKPADLPRYRAASTAMGSQFYSHERFVAQALAWLAAKYRDLHVEYHADFGGWQVSTCYANGAWGEDSWVKGDGSLSSALLRAVELSVPLEASPEPEASPKPAQRSLGRLQRTVLGLCAVQENATIATLAKELHRSPNEIAKVVSRLEDMGLLHGMRPTARK